MSPDYSIVTILRPFEGFEAKYEGMSVLNNPIAIPGKLDEMAGKSGYDPNLISGVPVPMGSRIVLWLPTYFPQVYGSSTPFYKYTICWRLRSLRDQIESSPDRGLIGHFGATIPGVPQEAGFGDNASQGGLRYVIPAAYESIEFPYGQNGVLSGSTSLGTPFGSRVGDIASLQAPQLLEPTDVSVTRKRIGTFQTGTSGLAGQYQAPLSPNFPTGGGSSAKTGKAGLISQGTLPDQSGITNPGIYNNAGFGGGPQFTMYETFAKGDEFILLVSRSNQIQDNPANAPVTADTWDFTGHDKWLSNVLGTFGGTRQNIPTMGVYLLSGANAG